MATETHYALNFLSLQWWLLRMMAPATATATRVSWVSGCTGKKLLEYVLVHVYPRLLLPEWLGIMDLVLGEIDLATVRLATGYCWCTGRLLEYDVVQALATAIARWMAECRWSAGMVAQVGT